MEKIIGINNFNGKIWAEYLYGDEEDRPERLFSIGVEFWPSEGIRIFDVKAETMPKGIYYLTIQGQDYEVPCWQSYDDHLDQNIGDEWDNPQINTGYIETVILDMESLKVERLDEGNIFECVIKERAAQAKEDAIFESGNYYR